MADRVLVLGGAGLVGMQICRQFCALRPEIVVVASLTQEEANGALVALQAEFPEARLQAAWGDIFLPVGLADRRRADLMSDASARAQLLDALYGTIDDATAHNHLANLIRTCRPDVVVDCVNTATGLSYQDVFVGAQKVRERLGAPIDDAARTDIEAFLLSQSVPQLVRHVTILHAALVAVNSRIYIKVGTTGTGGMGLNIPYTHGEDKPSRVLMAKTEAGFGHTGLLFLAARTPNGPVIKEIKPGAMIGFKGVGTAQIRRKGVVVERIQPQAVPVRGAFPYQDDAAKYAAMGPLSVPVVDTGENGVFSRGEFAAITALGQMEFVTPEEIAGLVLREVAGHATGREVVAALDASVLGPSYKAGMVRNNAMAALDAEEHRTGTPSVALGQLGPPELSKLLLEIRLLLDVTGSIEALARIDADTLIGKVGAALPDHPVRVLGPTIGVPILLSDGATLLRGPRLNVPEQLGLAATASFDDAAQVDGWAKKGWVDLRRESLTRWIDRAKRISQLGRRAMGAGSFATTLASLDDEEIGGIVAWVLANEIGGHRVQ